MNNKRFIVCTIFVLMFACKSHISYDVQSNSETKVKKIEFLDFTVKIKNKDAGSGNWTDLGTLVIRKEENGIEAGLNNVDQGGGHSSTFFSLEEAEINNFVKAMTEGGLFKTSLYYGYKNEQSDANGIKNKEIITKIEKINGSEYITFSGDKIVKNEEDEEDEDLGDRTAEYAISLEELKKNLK
ncbi:Erp family outer-surface lipoprotein (plasmid) [Borreliella tanukii]|uniref:Erp family outer-surface lipoprotein n=1 Tax=Borreliella tanukii TaxID=56146 RepID=UPI003AEF41F4